MHNDSIPLVSIGMPLFNEARFIEKSLRSLLNQDYPNIELIISDNASTDATLPICETLISNRPNTRINRFAANLGATENFRYVLREARGKYFMWASGHDLWAPNFVHETVALLEQTPSAAIAFGTSSWIDHKGGTLHRGTGWMDTRGMPPISRLFAILWGNMNPVLGLIRKSMLDDTEPLSAIAGADLVLLTELALLGDFIHATRTHFNRREFRYEASHSQKIARYRHTDYGLTKTMLDSLFPLMKLPLLIANRVIRSNNLSLLDKSLVMPALLASFPARYLAGKQANKALR